MRSVMRRATSAVSRPRVRSSISANTGRAPTRRMALAVDTKVKDGQITSCPGPMPRARSASSRAWVHEVVRSTRRPSRRSARRFSTRRPKGPSPAVRPCKASAMRAASASPSQAADNGMAGKVRIAEADIAGNVITPSGTARSRDRRLFASIPTDRGQRRPPVTGHPVPALRETGGLTAPKARPNWRSVLPYAAHLPVVAWVFSGALFSGQVPYFRDVLVYYYPNYVFLERSLGQGVWPLWNPTSDAGAPFLVADPIDLLLVGLLGAVGALRFGPPLHLALAMFGCTRLATTLGMGRLGGWAAGLFYGLSGYVLSTANLFQPFHATAWAPWVVAAGLRMWASPSPRGVAALASLAAVQVSTLGAETVLQTALVGVFLLPGRPDRRRLAAGVAAALLALLLAAPALLGTRALVEGTARAEGFSHLQSFAHSLSPVALRGQRVPPLLRRRAHVLRAWATGGSPSSRRAIRTS